MIKGEIKAGDVLYDVHSYKMGNTTMRRLGWWCVHVYSVDGDVVWYSWNSNPPRRGRMSTLRKFRRSIPKKIAKNGNTKPDGDKFVVPNNWSPPKDE